MAGSIEGLRLFQFGKESTPGTIVPATSKVAVELVDFEPLDEVFRPRLAAGLLHRYPGSETVIKRGTIFKIPETPVVYDQLQNFLQMSVVGGVSATGSNAVYTWVHERSLTADPAPNAYSFERRTTDASGPNDYKWGYGLLSMLAFNWSINDALKFSAEGFARRIQAATLTAALSLPTIEIPPAPLGKVWIDSTWANLGTTQVTGQLLKATVAFKTGLKPKFAFDGRTDLDFSTHVIDARECGLDVELTFLMAAQYALEKTAAEAQTLRAVRLKVTGSASRSLQIDMLLKHEKGSVFKIGEEDGQDMIVMKLFDSDDGTHMLKTTLVNTLNTDS